MKIAAVAHNTRRLSGGEEGGEGISIGSFVPRGSSEAPQG